MGEHDEREPGQEDAPRATPPGSMVPIAPAALAPVVPPKLAALMPGAAAAWIHFRDLLPWASNPRDNRKAIPKIARSIERFGFIAPVVVWLEANRMVAGHTRVAGMALLCERDPSFTAKGAPGPGMVRVVFHSFTSEADADAYAIADNKLAELATWDDAKLTEIAVRLPAEDRIIIGLDREVTAPVDPPRRPLGPSKLGRWRIVTADVAVALAALRANGERFDALMSDPPYGLSYAGKAWDITVPAPSVWSAAVAVLRPGAHVAAFSADRTYHRLACSIEDGGLHVRGMLPWLYGEGFPKSVNLPTALEDHGLQADALEDATLTWEGHGTSTKPGCEPACLARVPFDGTLAANLLAHGTGALWIDGARDDAGRWPSNVLLDPSAAAALDAATGEHPARPFKASDTDASVHPAHKGNRTAGGYTDTGGASRFFYVAKPSRAERDRGCDALPLVSSSDATGRKEGTAALASPRTGAGRSSGVRNHHPTLKPVSLMRQVATLLLPPPREDGSPRRLLVPYSGSGSEIIGALLAGWDEVVGIELDPRYVTIAEERIKHACSNPEAWAVEGTWNPEPDETEDDNHAPDCEGCELCDTPAEPDETIAEDHEEPQ